MNVSHILVVSLAMLLIWLSAGRAEEPAVQSPDSKAQAAPDERQRLLAELAAAQTKEQAAASSKLKALESKAAGLAKRIERIRRAKSPNPKTLERCEAEEKSANEEIEAQKAKLANAEKEQEQKRRRILLTHKMAGDPPLFEHNGIILNEEEMARVRTEENRPQPTAEQVRQVHAALAKARRKLAERELAGAHDAIAEAQRLAGDGQLQDTIAPIQALANGVQEFWKVVDGALPALSNSELQVGETIVFVIEARPDHLMIRSAGSNVTFTRQTMPTGLARTIAERSLENSATSKAVLGAFFAVDPKLVSTGGREQARALWKEAAAGGVDVTDLLKSLDKPAGP